MSERWLPVESHPGYEVSDLGRVRSLPRVVIDINGRRMRFRGCLLKQARRNGYPCVALGAGENVYVHRLVATAFVVGREDGLQVNHKDGVRSRNESTNLEWVTLVENNRHAREQLARPRYHCRPVSVGGVRYPSMKAASIAIGASLPAVSAAAAKGRTCFGMEVRLG